MKFLDGFKTVVGAVGLTVTLVAPHLAPQVQDIGGNAFLVAQGVFGCLTALGVIHKAEKRKK